jgi:nicotinamidase-related amidase
MTAFKKKLHLLVIDPQNDFCSDGNNGTQKGSLFVPGATEDMDRLTDFIIRLGSKLEDIHITLDSHHLLHIANPGFWRNSKGDQPQPFTQITAKDVQNGTWTTRIPSLADRAMKYLQQLESTNRYSHTIWPPHCLIGSWGHGLSNHLDMALRTWCDNENSTIDFVAKGSNPYTEHFSAVRAEVPDPKDPSSQINTRFIDALVEADEILIVGEALSHCVRNTVQDIADNFKDASYIQKLTLLTDCSSNVPGFEKMGQDFINEMTARGMKTATSDQYLR